MQEISSYYEDMIIVRAMETWTTKNNTICFNFGNVRIAFNKIQTELWESFDGISTIGDILKKFSDFDSKNIISFIKNCEENQLIEIIEENIWK